MRFGRLLGASALPLVLMLCGAGTAQAQSVDFVFVVDESSSMSGEHAFLQTFVPSIDGYLQSTGVNTRRYGLVGYGASNPAPRTHLVGGQTFGNATDFASAATGLVVSGSFEDGYHGMTYALNNYTFTGATRIMVLVTDEDRDVADANVTLATVTGGLDQNGIVWAGILDQTIRNAEGATAIGASATQTFVDADNDGHFEFSSAPTFGAAFGTTNADYTAPIIARPSGCVADLKQLRGGGNPAKAFAEALTVCVVKTSLGGQGPTGQVASPVPFIPVMSMLPTAPSLGVAPEGGAQGGDGGYNIGFDMQSVGASVNQFFSVASDRDFLVYGLLRGLTSEQDETAGQPGLDTNGGLISIGANARLDGNLTIGGIISYLTADTDAQGIDSKVKSDAVLLTALAGTKIGDIDASASLTVGPTGFDTTRVIGGAATVGSTDGFAVQVRAEGRMPLQKMPFGLTAIAGIDLGRYTLDAYTETGAAPLGYGEQTYTIGMLKIGAEGGQDYAMGSGTVRLSLGAGIDFRFLDENDGVNVTLFGSSLGTTQVDSPSDIAFRIAPKVGWTSTDGRWTARIGYEGSFGDESRIHAGILEGVFRF